MTRLFVPLLVFGVGVTLSAQQPPPRDPEQMRRALAYIEGMSERTRELIARRRAENSGRCVLPDGSTRMANTTTTFNGWTYRCVTTYDQSFVPSGTAWTLVPLEQQPPVTR